MELTIVEALQRGIAAHKAGKLDEAERLYRAILQSQPSHPDANHNLGVLAVSVNKVDVSLPFFKTALEANSKIEQFWLSYIDALIKDNKHEVAVQVLADARKHGVTSEKLKVPEGRLIGVVKINSLQNKLYTLLETYQTESYQPTETLAKSILKEYPYNQVALKVLGAAFAKMGRQADALRINQKVIVFYPQDAEAYYNFGNALQKLNKFSEAISNYTKAIKSKPSFAEAYYNQGNALKKINNFNKAEINYRRAIAARRDYPEAYNNLVTILKDNGKLEEAETWSKQSLLFRPEYATLYNNLGATCQALGRLAEAKKQLKHASFIDPGYITVFWNLIGFEKTISGAESQIDRCLAIDGNFKEALFTKGALRFYQGDQQSFDNLMKSGHEQHPFMRSFLWVFGLPRRPSL